MLVVSPPTSVPESPRGPFVHGNDRGVSTSDIAVALRTSSVSDMGSSTVGEGLQGVTGDVRAGLTTRGPFVPAPRRHHTSPESVVGVGALLVRR